MSIKLLNRVFEDQSVKSNEKLLLLSIADSASDEEGRAGTCFPSIKTLMKKTGLSNRSVINNLDSLVEKGYIWKQYRSRKKGGRSSNLYLIYPGDFFHDLDEGIAKGFTQSEECSLTPKVKNVHRGSEECSQGIATQSEECSQESEPSLIYNHNNNQYSHVTLGGSDKLSPRTSHSFEPVKEPIKRKQKKSPEIEKPENVSDQVWCDFNSQRRLKITQTALNGIIKQANTAGWTLEQALTEAVERGWQSFKAEWVNKPRYQQDNKSLTDIIEGWHE